MIYVFDLDGTLCHTVGNEYLDAEPFPSRILHVNALYDEGHTIIIDSARGSVTGQDWQALTARQLDAWGVQRHEIRTGRKPFGDYYVDDKAVNAEKFFA